MHIEIYYRLNEYIGISLGWKSVVHRSMYFINIDRVYTENGEVIFAKPIFCLGQHPKYSKLFKQLFK